MCEVDMKKYFRVHANTWSEVDLSDELTNLRLMVNEQETETVRLIFSRYLP